MTKFLSLLCFFIMLLLLLMCSQREKLIEGKWSPSGIVVGVTPSSYWFKRDGTVVANWMTQQTAFRSTGRYRFVDETHIIITLMDGYYEGRTYNYEIIKNDEHELILGDAYQDIKLKKVKDQ